MGIANDSSIKRATGAVNLQDSDGCAVKYDANGKLGIAGASDKVAGVVFVGGDAGQPTDYFLRNQRGTVRVRITSAVAVNDTLAVGDANGRFKTVTTGDVVAVALEAGTKSGQLVEAYLCTP